MPSTDDIQNSKDEKDFNEDGSESSVVQSLRESPARRPVRVFGLSNKLKKETRKLLGYPGKAMKRSARFEVNNLCDNENMKDSVPEDFSSYFKEHDILMEL
jgi:hypothetical protein